MIFHKPDFKPCGTAFSLNNRLQWHDNFTLPVTYISSTIITGGYTSQIQHSHYTLSAFDSSREVFEDLCDVQTDALSIDGTGKLVITNTGGSSASEGGMGSGSDDDREKGSLSKPGEKSGSAGKNDEDEDLTFDPIKKNVKEAEKKHDKE